MRRRVHCLVIIGVPVQVPATNYRGPNYNLDRLLTHNEKVNWDAYVVSCDFARYRGKPHQ